MNRAKLRLAIGLPFLLAAGAALADDAPVTAPSVAQPALPQTTAEPPAVATSPATAQPAPATPVAAAPVAPAEAAPGRRGFLYIAAGPGLITGLSGGSDFERSNPAVTGAVGVQIPVGVSTGIGFEVNADLELSGDKDRGSYAAALLRVRLAQELSEATRLWGGVGVGRAGYQVGSIAGAVAVGGAYMFVPKFGLDLSGSLNVVGPASDNSFKNIGVNYNYDGGLVLLVALRAVFEVHK